MLAELVCLLTLVLYILAQCLARVPLASRLFSWIGGEVRTPDRSRGKDRHEPEEVRTERTTNFGRRGARKEACVPRRSSREPVAPGAAPFLSVAGRDRGGGRVVLLKPPPLESYLHQAAAAGGRYTFDRTE